MGIVGIRELIQNRRYHEAFKTIDSLNHGDKLEAITLITDSITNTDYTLKAEGEFDYAIDYYKKNLRLFEKFSNKEDIIRALNLIGTWLGLQGELDLSTEYFQRSLTLAEETGNVRGRDYAIAIHGIGWIYQTKGELDLGLEYLHRSLEILEEIKDPYILWPLQDIGVLNQAKGNFKTASEFYEKSLAVSENIGEFWASEATAWNYHYLITLTIDANLIEKGRMYLRRLKELTTNSSLRCFYLFSKALLFKTHPRIKDKAKAQELLEQVAEEELKFKKIKTYAMLHLLELLIFELKTFGDKTILQDVQKLSNKLLKVAKSQHSYFLLIETYLFKSKLALLNLETKQAHDLLTQARILAEEKGLSKLVNKISHDQDSLLGQMGEWELLKFIDQTPSMDKLLELTQLEEMVNRMISEKLFRDEEKILEYASTAQQLIGVWEKDS